MRAVDLAVFADALAGRAGALAARLERGRDLIRQEAIECEARRSLGAETVARLVELGVLSRADVRGLRAEARRLAADLAAVEELQAWVEARLFAEREREREAEPARDAA